MKKQTTIYLLGAALLLLAGPSLAAGPESPGQVRFVDDAPQLKQVRDGAIAQHVQKMAEDLRLMSESYAKGLPMPVLATVSERQPLQQRNGFSAVRLGADQLHFLFVGTRGPQPVAACVESGTGSDRSPAEEPNPWPES